MNHQDSVALGETAIRVTRLGFGAAAIANLYVPVSDEDAAQAIATALDSGIRYFDTAPYYGYGLSERRLGAALRCADRDGLVLSTKVGRLLAGGLPTDPGGLFAVPVDTGYRYDYTGEGVRRSLADSLSRLRLDRIDIAFVHDLDPTVHTDEESFEFHLAQALDSAWPTLADLRRDDVVRAIGLGINDWRTAERIAAATDPDVILLAGRYTLLEQEAARTFLPMCLRRGISVVVGGPFNSGILATGPNEGAVYDYSPAPPKVLDRVRRIDAICRRHDVPLGAAALQFPFGHGAVVSVIPSMRTADEVRRNVAAIRRVIPTDLWRDLRDAGLLSDDAPAPGEV